MVKRFTQTDKMFRWCIYRQSILNSYFSSTHLLLLQMKVAGFLKCLRVFVTYILFRLLDQALNLLQSDLFRVNRCSVPTRFHLSVLLVLKTLAWSMGGCSLSVSEKSLPNWIAACELALKVLKGVLEKRLELFSWICRWDFRVLELPVDSFEDFITSHLVGQVLQHHTEFKRHLSTPDVVAVLIW